MSTSVTERQHKTMKSLMNINLDMVGVTGSIPVARTIKTITYKSQPASLASDWQERSLCDAGTSASVLCERPGPREPLPDGIVTLLWACAGIAVLVLALRGLWRWIGPDKNERIVAEEHRRIEESDERARRGQS